MTNTTKKTTKKYRYSKSKIALAIICAILVLVLAFLFCKAVYSTAMSFIYYPEEVSSTARYQLKMGLNNGDIEDINRYNMVYIANDKYLFDGPVTISACCDKYGLDYNFIYEDFQNSNYRSFQEYFDNEIKI